MVVRTAENLFLKVKKLDCSAMRVNRVLKKQNSLTCITGAPAHMNCKDTSAESMPPVARIGNPGSAFLSKKLGTFGELNWNCW